MENHLKHALSGNIHKIREFELEKVRLVEEFDILQIVGEGWFGKILLVEHKATDTEMVLKALPKPYTALKDFYQEFHYGLHLGVHKNIITAYDVAFETAGFYVFSQEYAPLGDLTSNVSDIGIGELHTKRVAKQLAAALEHIHSRQLVHRDIKLDNILVFKSDFSRIKLCDFGETRRMGSKVVRRNEWLPYAPPEVLEVPSDGTYIATTSHDVWQFGIVIFVCLTGCLPWQKAAHDDPRYVRYFSWQNSTLPIKRQPKLFKLVSSKAQRFFKKYLEPRPERRPTNLSDVYRYLEDRLMSKGMEKSNETVKEEEGLCPSMYSFHSSPDEKNKLLFTLKQYGLETTVDRNAKKDRIRQWIQCSVIEEENEDEVEPGELDEDNFEIHEIGSAPIGERVKQRGPISERKIKSHGRHSLSKRERRASLLKRDDGIYKPPIDPRIPLQEQKLKQITSRNNGYNQQEYNPDTYSNFASTSTDLASNSSGTVYASQESYLNIDLTSKNNNQNFEPNFGNNKNYLLRSEDVTKTNSNSNQDIQLNINQEKKTFSPITVTRNFSIYKALPFKQIQVANTANGGVEKRPPRKNKVVNFETPEEVKISSPNHIMHSTSNLENDNDNARFDALFNKTTLNSLENGNLKNKSALSSALPFKNVQVIDDSPHTSSGGSDSSLVKHKINVQLPQSDIIAHSMRSAREVHRKVIRQKQ